MGAVLYSPCCLPMLSSPKLKHATIHQIQHPATMSPMRYATLEPISVLKTPIVLTVTRVNNSMETVDYVHRTHVTFVLAMLGVFLGRSVNPFGHQ